MARDEKRQKKSAEEAICQESFFPEGSIRGATGFRLPSPEQAEQIGASPCQNFSHTKALSWLIKLLRKDGILPSLQGKLCLMCSHGKLKKMEYRSDRDQWIHRCPRKACHARIRVEDHHPIFFAGSVSSKTPLHTTQAAILLSALTGVPQHACRALLGLHKKQVESIYASNEAARALHGKSRASPLGGMGSMT